MIGVGGVVAYLVRARTYEFGVRMALGAAPGAVLGLVLRYGARLAAAGIVLGTAGSLAATRLLESYLFEVKALDPPTMVGAAALLSGVVIAACWWPARRVMQIDPAISLRRN